MTQGLCQRIRARLIMTILRVSIPVVATMLLPMACSMPEPDAHVAFIEYPYRAFGFPAANSYIALDGPPSRGHTRHSLHETINHVASNLSTEHP